MAAGTRVHTRVEVWDLPHNAPTEPLFTEPNFVRLRYNDSIDSVGAGSITLRATDPDADAICDPANNVSTQVRVYLRRDGETWQGPAVFLAEERERVAGDPGQHLVRLSGPDLRSSLAWGAVPPYDYPTDPIVTGNWEWGSEGGAGSFTNGDMEGFASTILSNGGFESGDLGAWQTTSAFGGPAVNDAQVSSNRSRSGSYSLFLDPLNVIGSGIRQEIEVEPGARYAVTIYLLQPTTISPAGNRWTARIKMGTAGTIHHTNGFRVGDAAYCELDNAVKGTGATISGGLPPNDNTVWQVFNIDVTMGDFRESSEDTTQTSYIEIAWDDDVAGSPPVYIDDATLTQVSGDGLAPWQPYTASTVTMTLQTTTVHGGAQALEFTATSFTGEGFPTGVQQLVTGLTPGGIYTFGAWVYNPDVVTRSVDLRLRQPGQATISLTTIAIPAGQWAFGTVTATSSLQSLLAEVRVNAAEEPNLPLTFYVDDCTFSGGEAATSVGDIIQTILTAVQARGYLTHLDASSFDAATDSDGNAWTDTSVALSVSRGANLKQMMDGFVRLGYEYDVVAVGSTYEFRVFNPGGLGLDVPTETILEGEAERTLQARSNVAQRTSTFVEGKDGIWEEVVDAGLQTALGPRESYLFNPDLTNDATLNIRGNAELGFHARYPKAFRISLADSAESLPFIDIQKGDLVTVNLRNLTGNHRCVARSIEVTPESFTADVELNERSVEDQALQAIAINKLIDTFNVPSLPGNPPVALATPEVVTAASITGPWIIVAASDAPDAWVQAATFVCDGVADEEEITAAIELAAPGAGLDASGLTVLLSEGNFFINAPIVIPAGAETTGYIGIRGQGIERTKIETASGVNVARMIESPTGQLELVDATWLQQSPSGPAWVLYTPYTGTLIQPRMTRVSLECLGDTANRALWANGGTFAGISGQYFHCRIDGINANNLGGRYVGCEIFRGITIDRGSSGMFVGCNIYDDVTLGDGTTVGGIDNSTVFSGGTRFVGANMILSSGQLSNGSGRAGVSITGCYGNGFNLTLTGAWQSIIIVGNHFVDSRLTLDLDPATYTGAETRWFGIIGNVFGEDTDITPLPNRDYVFRGLRDGFIAANRFWGRQVRVEECDGAIVNSNHIEGPAVTVVGQPAGLSIEASSKVSVLNNTFRSDGFSSGTDGCVLVDGASSDVFINGNTYLDTYSGASSYDYGVRVLSGATGVKIGTNDWSAAGVGLLDDAGTGTVMWLLDREAPIPQAGDDGLALRYEVTGDMWVLA